MITQSTIDQLHQKLDIVDVIQSQIQLKRSGTAYTACCPFHNEKTPSFHVTPAKQIFKCFGCGKGGNAINFIMEYKKFSYPETIQYLCDHYHITVEHENQDKEETEKRQTALQAMQSITSWAADKYEEYLHTLPDDAPVWQYLASRGYSRTRARQWSLGFAPDAFDFLKTHIINSGQYQPAADCGLIATKNETHYDFFRNRIMVPIYNHHGNIVGFGGRKLPDDNDSNPKYLNSKESPLYTKRNVWYGLSNAIKTIQEKKYVYDVEGYMDVQAMQDAGMLNTIAPCGTEMHDDHLKLLQRYTSHVVIMTDGDNSGQKAALKKIDRYLAAGFKTEIVELPAGQDPDEFLKEVNEMVAA